MAAGEGFDGCLVGTLNWWWDSTSGVAAPTFRNLFGAGQAPNPDYEYEFVRRG